MLASLFKRAFGVVFLDNVRLLEIMSALNLIQWARILLTEPHLLERDNYAGFQNLGAAPWAVLLLTVSALQIVPMLMEFRHAATVRFAAMCFAGGAWLVIALNFIGSGTSTTAEYNYLLLSTLCLISGAYLGWKSSSTH